MELVPDMLLGLSLILLGWAAWAAVERAWLKPWRMEQALRAQGLQGTPYRFPAGDLSDSFQLRAEVKPIPISRGAHDIAPHVEPLLYRTMLQYGKVSFHWFGGEPRITLTDPELVKEVLSNKFGHFGKGNNRLGLALAQGVAAHEGERWAKHRRILNPAFHMEKLKRMSLAFAISCEELVSKWEALTGLNESIEFDIWPEMQKLTGDVISRTAFGSNYQEGRRIFDLQAEQVQCILRIFRKIYIPFYWMLPMEDNKRLYKAKREIETILRSMIEKRKLAILNGKASHDDLLGLLLETNIQISNGASESKLSMTTDEIIEECKLFYFAGMETTSVLLTWTLIVLSIHPEWQNRARDEILNVFGKNKPDADGLSRLKIVTMVLLEVLRLYPPVTAITRKTYKPMKLGSVTYPSGVTLVLPILFIHHDPSIWGKDANKFNPERFAEGISKAASNPVAFFPFGGGPRICIGQNFALLEAKMALSMILQKFAVELSPFYLHAPYTVITVHPQHGAQIRLSKL